jgi:uncharacterized protein (DUF2267 family)
MTQRSLVQTVMDGARLDSRAEAEDMIRAVTGAMIDHFPPEGSELLSTVVPAELMGEGTPGRSRETASVEDLFEDVGRRRALGPPTAANYVRVVAEAVRGRLSEVDLNRLDDLLADEFLALFEVHRRGELTEDDGSTPGAKIVGGDEEAAQS